MKVICIASLLHVMESARIQYSTCQSKNSTIALRFTEVTHTTHLRYLITSLSHQITQVRVNPLKRLLPKQNF